MSFFATHEKTRTTIPRNHALPMPRVYLIRHRASSFVRAAWIDLVVLISCLFLLEPSPSSRAPCSRIGGSNTFARWPVERRLRLTGLEHAPAVHACFGSRGGWAPKTRGRVLEATRNKLKEEIRRFLFDGGQTDPAPAAGPSALSPFLSATGSGSSSKKVPRASSTRPRNLPDDPRLLPDLAAVLFQKGAWREDNPLLNPQAPEAASG